MEAEIREQIETLPGQADRYLAELSQTVAGKSFDMVLLAARGSSDHAALYARYLIEIHLGIPVSMAAPSVITRYHAEVRYRNCLAIGISQSGAAPDVSEVLANLRRSGHTTVGITNTAGSRLTEAAEHTLLLGVGAEQSIAATKTYSASLLALAQLVRAMGADLPPIAIPDQEWVERCRTVAEEVCGHIVRCDPIFVLGRGYSYCTAKESALKLMECALISARSYSTADFQHGPKALAGPGSATVAFGDDPTGIEESGTILIRAPQDNHNVWSPLWEIVFGQWLALLAARARGLDPDRAPNITKITETL